MRIGFLGLGIMGSRMAANLLAAGHTLAVWNRTPGRDTALVQAGAVRAATPSEAAQGADVMISMLSTPEAVEGAALGTGGFLPALPNGALWIDCSTVNPSFTRRMARDCQARGLRMLDAPVTGSKEAAEKGQLVFLVGGSAVDLEQARPLFEKMGKGVQHIGESGMGAALKIVNNMLVAQSMLAFAETLVLGESLGISHQRLLDFFLGGPAAAPLLSTKRAKLESGVYDPDFPLQWMRKDLQLAALTAYEEGVSVPSANVAKEIFQLAVRGGLAEADFSAIYQFLSAKQ
jgi:3-hydroxyisobutyrate dehydrogenase-like beta-hydroxyacid dehydrogenase